LITIFIYNFKPYQVAIGFNITLIDDYQKNNWTSPLLNVWPNSDIICFDYSHCKLILPENCLPNNMYKIIGDVYKNTYDIYQNYYISDLKAHGYYRDQIIVRQIF
jgi:hypothetical protein